MKKIEKKCTRSWCSVDILLPMRENLPWSSLYLLGIRGNKVQRENITRSAQSKKLPERVAVRYRVKEKQRADMSCC